MTWYIIGNNNIDATKFLGTTNNQPLVIKTNSTADPSEKMRVNPDGNVGIGRVPAPDTAYKLDVAGTINATDIHKNGVPLEGERSQWDDVNGGIAYVDGKVGIGTPAPSRKLHVHSGRLRVSESDGAQTSGVLELSNATKTNQVFTDGPSGHLHVRTDSATHHVFLQAGGAQGNVGIGSLTAREKLDVAGNIRWGNNWLGIDQGGCIELGGDSNTPGVGIPYIDFHFRGLQQDFNTRIINDENGRLSIVGNLNVTGTAMKPGGGWWSVASDIRLKQGVTTLKGALDKLLQLRGVSFEWKEPEKQGNLTGVQMGLIAQEVEEVLPEWVDADPSGYKNLTVRGFEALTVEAFRELKADLEDLRAALGKG